MRYIILVAGAEPTSEQVHKEDGEGIVAAYQAYTEELKKAGVLLSGNAFYPSERGTRVTIAGGKRKFTDGPFSESKEVVGGYFLLQVKSKAEALEWAARCPAAQTEWSHVEVREIIEQFSQG
jgi:hypothetical protein